MLIEEVTKLKLLKNHKSGFSKFKSPPIKKSEKKQSLIINNKRIKTKM